MATNNKVQYSSATTKQKIQLPADDPLVDILKSQYYDLVITANVDGSVILSLPNNQAFPSKVIASVEYAFALEENRQPLPFPNKSDIKLAKIVTTTDVNGVEKLKFVFNVKNNAGEAVIGAEGVGG